MGLLDRIFSFKPIVSQKLANPAGQGRQQGGSNAWNYFKSQTEIDHDAAAKYRDFREMGEYSDIASYLTAIVEDGTQEDKETGLPLWVEAPDEKVMQVIQNLFKRIELYDILEEIMYSYLQMGDEFLYADVYQGNVFQNQPGGILFLKHVDPEEVEIMLDDYRRVAGFKCKSLRPKDPEKKGVFEPYEFVHFRHGGKSLKSANGKSQIVPVRRTWRMLKMMEDASVIYKLYRGPDRNIFYVDVGNADPATQWNIVEMWKSMHKKKEFINAQTGEFDTRWNPIDVIEDLYWPIREGSASKIEKFQGSSNVQDISDMTYFLEKLFSGLRAPKQLFSYTEGEEDRGKALAYRDIRFARVVKSGQKTMTNGITRMIEIELAANGINPRDFSDQAKVNPSFRVSMTKPSNLEDLQRIEGFLAKVELAERLLMMGPDMGVPPREWVNFIAKDVLDLPQEIVALINQNTPQMGLIPKDRDQKQRKALVASLQDLAKSPEGVLLLEKLEYLREAMRGEVEDRSRLPGENS